MHPKITGCEDDGGANKEEIRAVRGRQREEKNQRGERDSCAKVVCGDLSDELHRGMK